LDSWQSSDFGFRLLYNRNLWTKLLDDGHRLALRMEPSIADLTLVIDSAPARQVSPRELLDNELDRVRDDVQNLTLDTEAAHTILGPGIGNRDGVGKAYTAEVRPVLGSGPGKKLWMAAMSASDGRVTAFASVTTTESDEEFRVKELYQEADSILNTFRWPPQS
jgi:hypothetical protein